MAHFAEVIDGVVTRVLVIEQDMVDTGKFVNPENFIKTSINTHGGIHSLGGTPLRKNYAGVGYIYDSVRNAFYLPQPYPSWLLDDDTCQWNAPTPMPDDGKWYDWDESTTNWVEAEE